jgi:hypothetical protein
MRAHRPAVEATGTCRALIEIERELDIHRRPLPVFVRRPFAKDKRFDRVTRILFKACSLKSTERFFRNLIQQ